MAEKLTARITSKKLAEAWGMSYQMVNRMVRMGTIPKPGDGGTWAWPDINIVYIDSLKKKPAATTGLTEERQRRERIKADREQIALERERGELLKTDLAQAAWGAVMQNVVNKLDNVSSKLAPLVHGLSIPETKAVADKMIDEVKNEIANPDLSEIARMASRKRNVKPGQAKAAPKRKRVGGSKQDTKPGGKRRAR